MSDENNNNNNVDTSEFPAVSTDSTTIGMGVSTSVPATVPVPTDTVVAIVEDRVEMSNEPANPALVEPDAMEIIRKGTPTAVSVTEHRKEELLLQARAERRKWVQQVPLPFANARDPADVWSMDDRLHPIHSLAVCKRMPTITKVLSELYGLETHQRTTNEIAERVETLTKSMMASYAATAQGLEVDQEKIVEEALANEDENVKLYHQFWSHLLKPECALLIQGMKNFLGNLEEANLSRLSGALKSYVDSTMTSTIRSHPAWKDQDMSQVRRSLESFIYGHAQSILDHCEWGGLFSMKEEDWMERLDQLQFINPNHLDIKCLANADSLDEILDPPMVAMRSIDQYFSPYEKLQRVLLVYKNVNQALSSALNNAKISAESRTLPSADDVLPTIILVVLNSKPVRLLRDLQFIELFAPPEYLRGEAGYAYTNLYGAVQFLQDLNMENPDSLSISAEEFKSGLDKCVNQIQKQFNVGRQNFGSNDEVIPKSDISTKIQVRDVRNARLQGADVDIQWAIQHQKDFPEKYALREDIDSPMTLPDGFTRSYSFLSASPQDIRLADLPKLLSEYKMMVHVTEQMLSERSTRIAVQRKKETGKNRQLDESFFGTNR